MEDIDKIKCVLIDFECNAITLDEAAKEILRLYRVAWRGEQLFCDCSQGKGADIDEDGFPYCIECQKNIAK